MFFSFGGLLSLAAGIGFLAMLLWGSTPALAQEAISAEEPTPSSVDQMTTPMERTFEEKKPRPGLIPQLKEALKGAPAFFRDTKLAFQLRTYYLLQDNSGSNIKEAWALGGSLSYQSGYFLDHFSVGGVVYTSQPVYAPDNRDGTNLLAPGQEGYTVLGQAYGRVKLVEDNFVNLYRYEYSTPFLNKNDTRMTPNTFEGYTFTGAAGDKEGGSRVTYGFGYVDKIKTRNDSTFQSMARAAGAQVDRGVLAGGLNYSYRGFQIGGIDYYSQDIINIGYGEIKYTQKITDQLGVSFAGQFADQQSVGANLLNGSSFHGTQGGFMANVSYRNGILSLAYTNCSTGANQQSPWGLYPGYTVVQVKDFNRAGEQAFMVKGSLSFARFGLEELSAYALWVHGWNAVDPATNQSVFQQDEYDLDVQWRPKSGSLKGLWFRSRYAHVAARDGNPTGFPIDELRFIVNYDFQLL
jgi:hypothetical protein